MPVVTIEWFEGRTPAQKAAVAERVTQALVEDGAAQPEHVWIRFDDAPASAWAIAGKLQG